MTHNLPTSDFPKWQRFVESSDYVRTTVKWDRDKVAAVSRAFGSTVRFSYIADKGDEWLLPSELKARGYGDCEDFALYRMSYLLSARCPPQNLEMQVGSLARGGMHAPLRVQVEDRYALILCNMVNEAIEERLYIQRTGFRPLAGFRMDGVRNYTVKEGV
jgi:predicted transglutaminase-like cysteine proteinase